MTCVLSDGGGLPGIAEIEYPVRPMLAMLALRLPTGQPGDRAAEPKLDDFLD